MFSGLYLAMRFDKLSNVDTTRFPMESCPGVLHGHGVVQRHGGRGGRLPRGQPGGQRAVKAEGCRGFQ